MKNRYDLIVFDWDGTLIDSIDWIVNCLQRAAEDCQLDIPGEQESKDIIGLSLVKATNQLFPGIDSGKQEQLFKSYSQYFFSKPISDQDFFEGVYDMLKKLKETEHQLAVATGKTRAGLQKALIATGVSDLFSTTRCADETASKPDPRMLLEIIDELDVEKNRVLMIGDSVHDIQMAENAGIASVAVSCGAHSSIILEKYNPLACFQQTTDLMNFVRG